MPHLPPEPFAAFGGIDWADAKHALCLQAAGATTRKASILDYTPEAIDAGVCTLRQRFGGHPVAICLELNKGPMVSALCQYEFLVLFPVNPLTLTRYRKAFTPSRAKDDPTDKVLTAASRGWCRHGACPADGHADGTRGRSPAANMGTIPSEGACVS